MTSAGIRAARLAAAGWVLAVTAAALADKPPAAGAKPGPVNFKADHPWGRFKAGSWVSSKTTLTQRVANAPGSDDPSVPPRVTVTERKAVLKEVKDDTYTLESTEGPPRNQHTTPLMFRWDGTPTGLEAPTVTVVEEKDEEVDTAGEKWPCHYTKVQVQSLQGAITYETWASPKAPGGWVKRSVANEAAGTGNQEVWLLDKKKETVSVGNRKLTCWVLKQTQQGAGTAEVQTTTVWRCADVPGLDAKIQSQWMTSDSKNDTVMEVSGFQGKH